MKRFFVFAALAAFALTSCEQKIDVPVNLNGSKVDASGLVFTAHTETATTKTALSPDGESFNVVWQNGDQITIVDGASTPNVGVYETESTTTTGDFTFVSGTAVTTPSYTAYYPASIYNAGTPTLPAEQSYVAGNISGAPMYATSSTTSLGFKNLTGIIRLNISTTLVGQKVRRITLSADQGMSGAFTVSSTNAAVISSGTAGVTLDCGTEGVAIGATAVPFHIAVPAGTYTNLTITVETTNGVSQSRKSKSGIGVSRSSITDVTLPFNNLYVDLSAAATANSYIVPGAGSYKFNATVKGNGFANLGGINKDTDASSIATAALIWATFGTATAPVENELIKDVLYKDGYVCFSTGDTFKEGNALVAIIDNSNNILWSWHIWLHDYNESYLTGADGVKMMDRDLGALSTNTGSSLSYGMFYQWGRKDPFIYPATTGVYGRAQNVTTGTVSIETAIQNPNNYYVAVNASGRWTNGDHWSSYASNMTLWSDTGKTIFDPCPPGWRMPSLSEITGMGNSYYTAANGFPASGYVGTEGGYYNPGNGTLWATTVDGTCAKIQVMAGDHKTYSRSPDMGFNVRCVKETAAPTPPSPSETNGSADIIGGGSQPWVQLWAGGPKWAKFNVGSTITSYENVTEWSEATVGAYYNGSSDVAANLWGVNWKFPNAKSASDNDFADLYAKCDWVWCDGVTVQYEPGCTLTGFKVTGCEPGYTGNSIFLPAAGEKNNGTLQYFREAASFWHSWGNTSLRYSMFAHYDGYFHSNSGASTSQWLHSVRAICVDNQDY